MDAPAEPKCLKMRELEPENVRQPQRTHSRQDVPREQDEDTPRAELVSVVF